MIDDIGFTIYDCAIVNIRFTILDRRLRDYWIEDIGLKV
jgi:hypothetical protein